MHSTYRKATSFLAAAVILAGNTLAQEKHCTSIGGMPSNRTLTGGSLSPGFNRSMYVCTISGMRSSMPKATSILPWSIKSNRISLACSGLARNELSKPSRHSSSCSEPNYRGTKPLRFVSGRVVRADRKGNVRSGRASLIVCPGTSFSPFSGDSHWPSPIAADTRRSNCRV
jgi:hypothetical protein